MILKFHLRGTFGFYLHRILQTRTFQLVHLVGSKWVTNMPQIVLPSPIIAAVQWPRGLSSDWSSPAGGDLGHSLHRAGLRCSFPVGHDAERLRCHSVLPSSPPTWLSTAFIRLAILFKIAGKSDTFIGLHATSFSASFYRKFHQCSP